MKTGQTNLGGIRYRVDVHEGMATFVESDRMSCARITIQKCEPHGLLYVQASSATGFVPYAHVQRAVAVCETLFGPNHYRTLEAKYRSERDIAISHIWRRPTFRISQQLFWRHDIAFRFASIWRAAVYQFRLFVPARSPWVDWEAVK